MYFQTARLYIMYSLTIIVFLLSSHYSQAFKETVFGNGLENLANGKISFDEEYRLFEEELEQGIAKRSGKSRHKRYVYWNTEANVDVGFLIVIPITVVLPSMTNLFNKWRRRRSVSDYDSANFTSEINPMAQAELNRVQSYFELIDIPETACQLRAVCEFSADPNKYFPLSDIIISKVRSPSISLGDSQYGNETFSSTTPSLLNIYTNAAENGASYGEKECENIYSKTCKYSMDKLLNMPIMKFWNKIQSKLRLKFDDVSEYSIL
ncbi:hypothetical protein Ocin01_03151 [Orchesella cincta]|uniref:Uncharacterized protein n=1 Tax=Orchesella cincta TaxID=48709 RepID=A0A1D2NE52_ORCCI|nr:hypothetical protein Ocin01_03151 [Orchesella cincta]